MYKLIASPNCVIRKSDGACIPADPANADYAEYLRWVAAGGVPDQAPSSSVPERIALLEDGVQRQLDSAARGLGYGGSGIPPMASAVTYADESSVPRFQAEGRALRTWRSLVWAKCYEVLAQWESGAIPEPTLAELIAMLPALELPA